MFVISGVSLNKMAPWKAVSYIRLSKAKVQNDIRQKIMDYCKSKGK